MKLKITCLNCGGSNIMFIYPAGPNNYHADLDKDHKKSGHANIISARYRADMQWGFECTCGQDSRLSRQEAPEAKTLVMGGGKPALDRLMGSLKETDENKFKVEEV